MIIVEKARFGRRAPSRIGQLPFLVYSGISLLNPPTCFGIRGQNACITIEKPRWILPPLALDSFLQCPINSPDKNAQRNHCTLQMVPPPVVFAMVPDSMVSNKVNAHTGDYAAGEVEHRSRRGEVFVAEHVSEG